MGTELIKNIIIVLFLALGLIVILYLWLKTKDNEKEKETGDIYAIGTMVDAVKQYINGITGEIVQIRSEEDRKRELERAELGKAVRNCGNGNMGAKAYVKEQIKKWLLGVWLNNRSELDRILPFDRPEALGAADKFEILLYDYSREFRSKAAARLLDDLLDIHAGRSTQTL